MIEIVSGDLLTSPEKYLLHQTNCVSTTSAKGIAKDIFDQYPYADCYQDRIEPSKPSTIDIRGNGIDQRYVINMHSQYYPGKPKYPDSNLDGIKARETYFYHGLLRVAKIPDLESVAMPYNIACGFGGLDWNNIYQIILNFTKYVNSTYGTIVKLYQLE